MTSEDAALVIVLTLFIAGSLLLYLNMQPHAPYLYTMPPQCGWYDT